MKSSRGDLAHRRQDPRVEHVPGIDLLPDHLLAGQFDIHEASKAQDQRLGCRVDARCPGRAADRATAGRHCKLRAAKGTDFDCSDKVMVSRGCLSDGKQNHVPQARRTIKVCCSALRIAGAAKE